METKKKTCCVFGHRKIDKKDRLKDRLLQVFENLIVNENVETFFVGSRSEFDDLCREVLFRLKEKYPHIRRIYIRAEYADISKEYEDYLLKSCDETYFPERARDAGRAVYIEQNREMIDKSDICIVCFKDGYLPAASKKRSRALFSHQSKSGTGTAYKYALLKKKKIINMAEYT